MLEAKRVCKKRIIISDPNPMWVLIMARKLINHVDPVCSPADAKGILEKHDLELVHQSYSEVFAFPASGGFVGKPLLPNFSLSNKIVLGLDNLIGSALNLTGLGGVFCWRYLIVADIK